MVRILSHSEYKEAWRWETKNFTVKVGDSVAYLYNQRGELLQCSNFFCDFDKLDMSQFWVQCIYILTKIPVEQIRVAFEKRHKVKEKLWDLYSVPIDTKKYRRKRMQWVKIRNEAKFCISMKPNDYPPGYFYGEIYRAKGIHSTKLMSDNVLELLCDLFLTMECHIGKEEIPETMSACWFNEWDIYGDRRFREVVSRYNIEQSYIEYMIMKINEVFNNTTRATFIDALELFRRLNSENKYYIMEILLSDHHYSIDENGYIIYQPTKSLELEIL